MLQARIVNTELFESETEARNKQNGHYCTAFIPSAALHLL